MSTLVDLFERETVRHRKGRTLIAGSQVTHGKKDRRKLYPKAIGIDQIDMNGVDRIMNLEEEIPSELIGYFAACDCLSVLEHSRRPWLLAANIERMLMKGGTLFISVPWHWRRHDYPGDFWRISADGLRVIFPSIEWKRIAYAANQLLPEDCKKIESVHIDGHSYIARTETVGFGVKV